MTLWQIVIVNWFIRRLFNNTVSTRRQFWLNYVRTLFKRALREKLRVIGLLKKISSPLMVSEFY